MPRAYYQCPTCREVLTTQYKETKRRKKGPVVFCPVCKELGKPQVRMTYRGDGWDGRNNMPHGTPPSWIDEGEEAYREHTQPY